MHSDEIGWCTSDEIGHLARNSFSDADSGTGPAGKIIDRSLSERLRAIDENNKSFHIGEPLPLRCETIEDDDLDFTEGLDEVMNYLVGVPLDEEGPVFQGPTVGWTPGKPTPTLSVVGGQPRHLLSKRSRIFM